MPWGARISQIWAGKLGLGSQVQSIVVFEGLGYCSTSSEALFQMDKGSLKNEAFSLVKRN